MKKLLLVIGLVLILLVSGCGSEEIVEVKPVVEEEVEDNLEEDKVISEEASHDNPESVEENDVDPQVEEVTLPMTIDETIISDFQGILNSKDLASGWAYVNEVLLEVNPPTAEALITAYMVIAESQVGEVGNPLYEEGWELHEAIYKVLDDYEAEFDHRHVIIGKDKDLLIGHIDEAYKDILENLFDMGYGLVSAEGSYYPVVDYKLLIQMNSDGYPEMTRDFLELQLSGLMKQTTVEEYLNLTAYELMNRSISLEEFLITYKERPKLYTDMMTRQLNLCLFKLSIPSPLDGGVGDDGKLSEDFSKIYELIIESSPTPVVTNVVSQIVAWIDGREDGYIGSYNDMDDLFKISGEIYGHGSDMVTNLYKD